MTAAARRPAVPAAAALAVAVLGAGAARADDLEPVRLTVTAPATARTGAPIPVTVGVDADAGALDPRAGTLRVGVRLAAACGGAFASTAGATAIDAPLAPQPAAGAAYAATARGSATVRRAQTLTVCTYLVDDEGRQWATDTDAQVAVSAAGDAGGGAGGGSGGAGGGGTGGAGSGAGGCRPAVAAGTTRVHPRGALLLRYRACARGRYRFTILRGTRRVATRTVRVTRAGRARLHVRLGRRATGRCRVVMVLPSGRHVAATRSVRVLAR